MDSSLEGPPLRPALLELVHISKAFGGVQALIDVTVDVKRGEVHAVVGENGAGKSTLMKIIAGAIQPDSGSVEFAGETLHYNSPRDAAKRGVAVVYQEPQFFPELSVLENFYLGDELRTPTGGLAWGRMARDAATALAEVHLPADIVTKRMADLSLGTQELVLIARAVHREARILILDEPTAILSQAETDILFDTIRRLKSHGASILYVSHRIGEIFQIADRITVLRDGRVTARYPRDETNQDQVVTAMSGREINMDTYRGRDLEDRVPILQVRHLTRPGSYEDVSFRIRPGEVLGMYGLIGSGRSEIAEALFGVRPAEAGELLLDGRPVHPRSSRQAIRLGISYVPEDRQRQGLFPVRTVRDNLSASRLSSVADFLGIIRAKRELALAVEQIERLSIKTDGALAPVSSLSGGGQQKVVLARWLVHRPRVLILDEPTRGIDIGTKAQIHQLIMTLAEQDVAVLLISSELVEVLGLADNVLVMHEGTVTGYLPRKKATEKAVLRLALGIETPSEESSAHGGSSAVRE